MKIFAKHIEADYLEKFFEDIKHIDFSFFMDDIPKNQEDLSPINIIAMQEPNEYFGIHDWVIQNKNIFDIILTWDDKVLNNCKNAIFLPFGNTWVEIDQEPIPKKFQISHLCGKLLKTYGHSLRHELYNRENEIKIPTKFFDVYGDRYNFKEAIKGKKEIFGDSMFGVVIENTSHRGYFTEKIMDCFLLKTIPIYWGCSNISDFFNKEGIIEFGNIDDFIYISNKLTEDYYNQHIESIEENYQIALKYKNEDEYGVRITNNIKEIFKFNNII
jgi:hypothetical protein